MSKTKNMELLDDSKVYKEVLEFKQLFSNIWWNTDKQFPSLGEKTTYWYKIKKEKETDKFIDEFVKLIKQFPGDEENRKLWRNDTKLLIDDFVSKSDLISRSDKEILLNQGMLENTKNFIDEARSFNEDMSMADIGQAMRNVWIMNITQLLLGKPAELTPAIFGYSMLYPYTDNYLDDAKISKKEKLNISDRFEKRLAGESIQEANEYEKSLFQLVSRIEEQYKRSNYPEVFESLIAIHRAQKKSLLQQGKKTGPYESDILGISIEKGGISVLADAYLVNGTLKDEEAAFFFGYGVLLQICDDLQDAKGDLASEHMTIISQISKKWPLDSITNGLINFTYDLMDNAQCFNSEKIDELKDLIRKNCLLIILLAIANNKKLYSRKYFNEVKKYFPYRISYMSSFNKRLKKKYSNMKTSYNGVKTEDIIIYALS
jgi:hypothetical protein